jgi:hypothetical protein
MRTDLVFFFGVVLLAAAGCASAPREAQEKEASTVRALDPAACQLAVMVSQGPAPSGAPGTLRFTKDVTGLRDAVVQQLASLNTASSVIAVADAKEAMTRDADVLLDLSVTASGAPTHRGLSSGWWSSGLLWLVTWIGGLLTDDSTYQTSLTLNGRFVPVGELDLGDIGAVSTNSTPVDLSYWERNTVASWRFLQSLVLPPFWTTDDPELTSQALAEHATMAASVKVADYVKRRLEEEGREKLARLLLKQPATTGTTMAGASTPLEFVIESTRAPIGELAIAVNGRLLGAIEASRSDVRGVKTCAAAPRRIDLQPGANTVRIKANVGGKRFARTVIIHRRDG